MAERRVVIRQVSPKPQEGQRLPVLVIAWPPVREGGPWTVEVRAPKEAVTARIVVPPIAFIDDPEAELLGEEFVRQRIPRAMDSLLLLEEKELEAFARRPRPSGRPTRRSYGR